MNVLNFKYSFYIAFLVSLISYLIFGYLIDRESFNLILMLYSFLFLSFIVLMKTNKNDNLLFWIGIFFRIIFLFSTPFFSQDFYRFIWDGRLIVAGINPYEFLPNDIINSMANFSQSQFLYNKMGSLSAAHFSNYPPINQLLFAIAGFISGKSIIGSAIFFRTIIIFSDIGIYFFGRKILNNLNLNPNQIFLYFLNPLVILELTGNLHFEGVMLFFLLLGLYKIMQEKYLDASFFIAISISIKLLPLLLLPLFYKKLTFRRSIIFYLLVVVFNVLFFMPFLNESLVNNYIQTISLWFTNFEFNASFYYIIREIGFYIKGYNIIGIIGKIIPIITILIILYFSFFRENATIKNIFYNALIVLSLYFFIATTVHPWYVINLILLSVFTKYKFPIVWSFFIILSYFAYSQIPFQENYWFLFIEYFAVFAIFILEIKNINLFSLKNKSLQI